MQYVFLLIGLGVPQPTALDRSALKAENYLDLSAYKLVTFPSILSRVHPQYLPRRTKHLMVLIAISPGIFSVDPTWCRSAISDSDVLNEEVRSFISVIRPQL